MSIAENLNDVNMRIAAAAIRSGRKPEAVRLIAVSKTKPLSVIDEAIRAGQRSFGENYVQEALAKIQARPEVDWHFIGSLQSNKAKLVVGQFSLIHSVDRLKLANDLNQAAARAKICQEVLLQIHIGDEATKHGVGFADAPELLEAMLQMSNLRVRGLMSLPPLTEDERVARGYFSQLREALLKWQRTICGGSAEFSELSMGTSSDFEWAILEGATMVRVGTTIFGAREKREH